MQDNEKDICDVAKQRCDDQVGDAKDSCRKQAKAERDQMEASAKKQIQAKSSSSSQSSSTGSSSAQSSGGQSSTK